MKYLQKMLTHSGSFSGGSKHRIKFRGVLLVACLLLAEGLATTACAQATDPTKTKAPASTGKSDTAAQLLEFSRPGGNHALLGTLAGTWNFQDARLPFVKGILVRKPIYDGRFYTVEITGGKLQVPVAGGKMKDENYQGMQLEGYDNGRQQFVATSVNNHIGSDIEMQSGTYDVATKSFIYTWESELIPGMKKKNRRVLKVIDATHYSEEYFEDQNGKETKVRQLDYTRAN